jgi:hypothetical protein
VTADGPQEPVSITYRNATPADKDEALALLERSFGFPHSESLWEWLFIHNPSGSRMFYRVAEAADRLAGQYATMPARFQHADREVTALVSLHTATDPDFGRRGIFTKLASQLYADAASQAVFVYGFPNVNSAPGLYQKLGWVELRPYPLFLRPLGNIKGPLAARRSSLAPFAAAVDTIAQVGIVPARVRTRRGRGQKSEVISIDSFGPWADQLWESLRSRLGTCAIRDASFLNWRFSESPFAYTIYGLDRGSGPVGFAVLSLRPWRGGHTADLMELMTPLDDPECADLLLARATIEAASRGAIAIRAIVSPHHPHRRAFLKSGFLPVPKRFKQNYSFGVRVLEPSNVIPNRLLHVDDWYISGADLDYF